MKFRVAFLMILIVCCQLVSAADLSANTNTASAEVAPLLAQMGAAANAHDIERHVGFYAHDSSVIFIFNGQATIGWDAIRENQDRIWRSGKSDVVYTMQGKPSFLVPAPDLVVTTIFLKSRRTMPNGQIANGEFAVSSVWQKRPEGWRVIYSHESTTH